jgi:hypothetical protein
MDLDDLIGGVYSALSVDRLPAPEQRPHLAEQIRRALFPPDHFSEQVRVAMLVGRKGLAPAHSILSLPADPPAAVRSPGAVSDHGRWTSATIMPVAPMGTCRTTWPGYWAERRSKNRPLLDRRTLHLLRRQHGSCPICGELLLHADREPQSPREWEQWHRTTRKAITRQIIAVYGNGLPDETRLVHSSCLRRTTDGQQEPASLHT